jgi:hypothetical protein
MAGHLLFNSGSNESSLVPQFKWLDNTFKYEENFVFFFISCELLCCMHTVRDKEERVLKWQSGGIKVVMSANVGWGPGEEGTIHVLTN